jgi:hypothetical protein
MLYNGRRSGIKDGIGFQQGSNVKLNAPKRLSNFVKGKAPMVQDNEGYILYPVNGKFAILSLSVVNFSILAPGPQIIEKDGPTSHRQRVT